MDTQRSPPQEPSEHRRDGTRSEPTPIYEHVLRDIGQDTASPARSKPPGTEGNPADDVTGTASGHTGEPDWPAAAAGGR